jgi:hypothetical protein
MTYPNPPLIIDVGSLYAGFVSGTIRWELNQVADVKASSRQDWQNSKGITKMAGVLSMLMKTAPKIPSPSSASIAIRKKKSKARKSSCVKKRKRTKIEGEAMKALTPLKKYKVKVLLAPLFKLFECVCELFVPFLVKDIIDMASVNSDGTYILWRSLIMLALAIAGFGVTMITQYLGRESLRRLRLRPQKGNLSSPRRDFLESTRNLRQEQSLSPSSITIPSRSKLGSTCSCGLFVRAPFLVIGSVISAFILVPVSRVHRLGALLLSSIVLSSS